MVRLKTLFMQSMEALVLLLRKGCRDYILKFIFTLPADTTVDKRGLHEVDVSLIAVQNATFSE